jgi:hypothetical protein
MPSGWRRGRDSRSALPSKRMRAWPRQAAPPCLRTGTTPSARRDIHARGRRGPVEQVVEMLDGGRIGREITRIAILELGDQFEGQRQLAVGRAPGVAPLDLAHELLDGCQRSPAEHAIVGHIDAAVRNRWRMMATMASWAGRETQLKMPCATIASILLSPPRKATSSKLASETFRLVRPAHGSRHFDPSHLNRQHGVDNQLDAHAQICKHVRRRCWQHVAPNGSRKAPPPAGRRLRGCGARSGWLGTRTEPRSGKVGDRAIRALWEDQRQRSRPECRRQAVRAAWSCEPMRRRGVRLMRDQRVERGAASGVIEMRHGPAVAGIRAEPIDALECDEATLRERRGRGLERRALASSEKVSRGYSEDARIPSSNRDVHILRDADLRCHLGRTVIVACKRSNSAAHAAALISHCSCSPRGQAAISHGRRESFGPRAESTRSVTSRAGSVLLAPEAQVLRSARIPARRRPPISYPIVK